MAGQNKAKEYAGFRDFAMLFNDELIGTARDQIVGKPASSFGTRFQPYLVSDENGNVVNVQNESQVKGGVSLRQTIQQGLNEPQPPVEEPTPQAQPAPQQKAQKQTTPNYLDAIRNDGGVK